MRVLFVDNPHVTALHGCAIPRMRLAAGRPSASRERRVREKGLGIRLSRIDYHRGRSS
jgi:hypothetical protein